MLKQTFLIQGQTGKIEVAHDFVKKGNHLNISVIICHPHPQHEGTMNNKVVTTISRAFKELGVESYRFNYRGVGKSEGVYDNGIGEFEDLKEVHNFVKKEKPKHKIIIAGFSFGGGIAYKGASSLYDIVALVTVGMSLRSFSVDDFTLPSINWLAVHSIDDDVVPAKDTFDYILNQISAELTLLKVNNTGHFFHGKLMLLKNEIIKYFESRL